jgi:hypothetical protein
VVADEPPAAGSGPPLTPPPLLPPPGGGDSTSPGRNKQEAVLIEHRRREVARLYLLGCHQAAIARDLGPEFGGPCDRSTISRDIRAIRAEWKRERIKDFEARLDYLLAKIDHLELTYWDAWERSKDPTKMEHHERTIGRGAGGASVKSARRTTEHVGEESFLGGVRWCIAERARLLLPIRMAMTDRDQAHDLPMSGVVLMPSTISAEEWSGVAQAQQRALLARNDLPGTEISGT